MGNAKDRLYLTNSWECWIRYCFYKVLYIYYITSINDFKKDCNNIFEFNLSIEVILYRLKKLINKYNQKRNFNNKFLRFIRNYIKMLVMS